MRSISNEKSISKKLMKNYISMYMLTVALTIFTAIMLLSLGSNFSNYDDINYANELMEDDYNKIDVKFIKDRHGTAFVVNRDLKVMTICGDNLPKNDSFTMAEWTDFINKMDLSDRNFKCDIDYNNKNQFWLVVKMPIAVNCMFNFNINTTKEVLPEAIFIVTILCLICFGISSVYIYAYSKLTSKYFVKPLDMFCNMVKNLEEEKYAERLKIYKNDEF